MKTEDKRKTENKKMIGRRVSELNFERSARAENLRKQLAQEERRAQW